MPLLHQSVTLSLRLDRQAVKQPRLAHRKTADVDHFLHCTLDIGDNFAGFERHQLAERVFHFAQSVAEAANGFATDGSRRSAPFQKRFLRARNCRVVVIARSSLHGGEFPTINWRDFVDLAAAATPFPAKDARIFPGDAEFLENGLHDYLRRRRQYLRISSVASSRTPAVRSSAGRKRIELSPERRVSRPRSKKPFQNSSRVFGSGRSNARNSPRPRAAEIIGSSRCKSRSWARKYVPTFAALSTRRSSSIIRK